MEAHFGHDLNTIVVTRKRSTSYKQLKDESLTVHLIVCHTSLEVNTSVS